ncbi:MAG: hypothetical protein L0Y73_00950 [Candidatus Aminicenantes bacterium]|nr:hypothetical protein [Candidatus Aminicenantes bacterium]
MDVTKFFINYRKAAQYIYGGENYIEIYKRQEGSFKKTKTFEKKSLLNVDSYDIEELKKELAPVETGILLNSGYFIFNIFEFDRIPFHEEMRKDLVAWRVQKVFPEDIEQYEHDFFKLDRKKILSILFKKSLKQNLEQLFAGQGIRLLYIGNSTIEIINNVRNLRPAPDFFIEIDKNLCIVVFRGNSVPFYIRKFRSDKEADIAVEIIKTVNFVKNSYQFVPVNYLVVVNSPGFQAETFRGQLSELNLNELTFNYKKKIFLPA